MEGSSSPTGEGDVSEVLDEESERRRRRKAARARRRTVVGIPLDRMRSVSCEALTLLDTSDLDSCHSEWDDEDQNSNYVTLNRPISRKRILQNSSRSDSDDSGVEYHSNEEDPILEKTSSNGDDIEQHNMLIPQVKVTQIDTDTTDVNEPDPLPEEVLQEQISQNQDDLLQEEDLDIMDENQEDALEFELSHCVTPTVEETFEQLQLSGQFNQTDEETWIKVEDVQVADKDQISNIRQARPLKHPEDQHASQTQDTSEVGTEVDMGAINDNNNNSTSSGNTSKKTNNLLENPKLVIVETTPSVPIRKAQHNEIKDPVEEELRLKRQVYNIRNKEVRLEELPTPNTVSSVKNLFENLHQNIDHFESFRQIGWFRDIKSNTSSKILRFSRSRDSSSSSASSRMVTPRCTTLPRLPSQHTKAAPRPSPRSSLAQRLAAAPVVTSLGAGRGGMARRRQMAPVASSAHGGVALRKPQVRGFNVLKALAEDPRRVIQPPNTAAVPPVQPLTFHPVVTYSRSAPITGKRTAQLQQQHHNTQHSYMDRSDCESLSSDTSEDSGVSGGSSISSGGDRSSTSTSSSVFHHHDHPVDYRSLDNPGYRSLDSYSQDPSFKWIDPKIMSKIRAKGTTVIFFGPKHKKNSSGGQSELEAPTSRCSTPVFVLQPQAGQMAQT
ncbi:unnamed protein product [Meganyctiphanes norvegica]|uniref:Uncharacterized protein n=1 Tax=Meganyctiphanes norvegica TaxID=48144 RepID=A0AAV2QXW6_MEGNR